MNTERTSSGRAEKSDSPITSVEQDLLGFDAHAGAIAELIDDPDRGGRTIVAINGSAGSGKTSVGNLVEGHLRRADPERPESKASLQQNHTFWLRRLTKVGPAHEVLRVSLWGLFGSSRVPH